MTGVPASAAGGPSGARRVKGPASGGLTPASGRALAREARDRAPGGSGGGKARRDASGPEDVRAAAASSATSSSPSSSEDTGIAGTAEAQGSTRAPRGGKIAAAAVDQASVWNIANLLTMLRLLLVPAFVMLMLADGGYDPAWRSFAWAAFAIAMITDLFDGHLARTYNLVTDFGKIADPIADKAIMGAALICLSALGDLPWWVTGVILGRELGITLLRFLVIRYGVIPASRGGKLKTLTQGVAVGMYVLALTGWLATLRWWVMAAAVVLTVVTGLDYVKQAIVLRRQGIAERKAALEETEE
ncbi:MULTISPECIES: CDP-diacylglycerol--glycerol-3-phosphate 3-phosphatidyltransferase [Streptomyces]|uniref:CDP-diacylglycerol--glycerol-3-phosphate 3-phosphatidyltransferase n=1 Tax=Streptomyces pseudogriseolus TaxID=36817 RepID=A0ABQ2SKV9_STREZ|nr:MULTISPECIES: CDP-diacylglycerol--glycerol-3-phosphate 3-phosphatidyltransferase [Streptomyces]MCI4140987.1 CDP-diacylglycerol--glycerol-3-phosphate 3-phosphatidyltransferase [Streptomyces sp. MMS20-AI2-20]GGP95095.1 CDP-diacylglycerol--glycerol-3-phosphate 3-phosphatidyltransferase [Streptomyces gancidicus]GGS30551.1 CDP-diacylglycerol--glycerol-3-phosphate 3-phosphatidyltransferase [Streptomyces rubiginosus]